MDFKIIAVDFDGTLCENKWPGIGEPNKELIAYLKERQAAGDKLVLWTCRVGEILDNAVAWSAEQGIIFDAVNENLPEVLEWMGGDTRKVFANEYIDDRNFTFLSQTDCMELLGRMVDVVEDWLEKKGMATDDEAAIKGDDYDYLVEGFAAGMGISRDCVNMDKIADAYVRLGHSNILFPEEIKAVLKEDKPKAQSWAEREIEIACKHERGDSGSKDGEWDYGCACYESALKAYKSLMGDGHTGFSIGMTKYILNRLIEHKPLTPIEDKEDVWNDISDISGGCVNYQCKRMSSLFKYVYPDGTIKYRDVNRFYGVNLDNPNGSYHSGLIDMVMEELYPIRMPYFPTKSFKVVCEEFLTDRKNGDFDTVGMLYFIDPDGVRMELNRYFKEGEDDFVVIDKDEYEERRVMYQKLLEEMNDGLQV